ncbi:hypothetical protein C6503_03780 [Candidatus Poribacteria bacterium]|nr:MAG: hypothetical protein C6503_03780 [Candidatus Poribacteria bacterium]
MENTIIIKEDGLAINSATHFDYCVVITNFAEVEWYTADDGSKEKEQKHPHTIELRATGEPKEGGGGTGEAVLISTFYEIIEATDALQELVGTIERGNETFDVRDYNSNV